jgi:hypothetical protein
MCVCVCVRCPLIIGTWPHTLFAVFPSFRSAGSYPRRLRLSPAFFLRHLVLSSYPLGDFEAGIANSIDFMIERVSVCVCVCVRVRFIPLCLLFF